MHKQQHKIGLQKTRKPPDPDRSPYPQQTRMFDSRRERTEPRSTRPSRQEATSKPFRSSLPSRNVSTPYSTRQTGSRPTNPRKTDHQPTGSRIRKCVDPESCIASKGPARDHPIYPEARGRSATPRESFPYSSQLPSASHISTRRSAKAPGGRAAPTTDATRSVRRPEIRNILPPFPKTVRPAALSRDQKFRDTSPYHTPVKLPAEQTRIAQTMTKTRPIKIDQRPPFYTKVSQPVRPNYLREPSRPTLPSMDKRTQRPAVPYTEKRTSRPAAPHMEKRPLKPAGPYSTHPVGVKLQKPSRYDSLDVSHISRPRHLSHKMTHPIFTKAHTDKAKPDLLQTPLIDTAVPRSAFSPRRREKLTEKMYPSEEKPQRKVAKESSGSEYVRKLKKEIFDKLSPTLPEEETKEEKKRDLDDIRRDRWKFYDVFFPGEIPRDIIPLGVPIDELTRMMLEERYQAALEPTMLDEIEQPFSDTLEESFDLLHRTISGIHGRYDIFSEPMPDIMRGTELDEIEEGPRSELYKELLEERYREHLEPQSTYDLDKEEMPSFMMRSDLDDTS